MEAVIVFISNQHDDMIVSEGGGLIFESNKTERDLESKMIEKAWLSVIEKHASDLLFSIIKQDHVMFNAIVRGFTEKGWNETVRWVKLDGK